MTKNKLQVCFKKIKSLIVDFVSKLDTILTSFESNVIDFLSLF